MRTEYVKSFMFINGTKVFDLGVEYVFCALNEKGVEVEHHLAKLPKIALEVPIVGPDGKPHGATAELEDAIYAMAHFPNLGLKEAVIKYLSMTEKKGRAA